MMHAILKLFSFLIKIKFVFIVDSELFHNKDKYRYKKVYDKNYALMFLRDSIR